MISLCVGRLFNTDDDWYGDMQFLHITKHVGLFYSN